MNKKKIKALFVAILFLGVAIPMIAYFASKLGTKFEDGYLAWVGIVFGIASIVLTLYIRIIESDQKEEMDKDFKKFSITLDEIKKSINSNAGNQQTQNERLNNIEKELKVYQKKLTSTNLLAIFINRRKQNEKDYD